MNNCGSKEYTENIGRIEKNILDNMLFSCQNEECEEEIKHSDYLAHLQYKCKYMRYRSIMVNDKDIGIPDPRFKKMSYRSNDFKDLAGNGIDLHITYEDEGSHITFNKKPKTVMDDIVGSQRPDKVKFTNENYNYIERIFTAEIDWPEAIMGKL